MSHLDALALLNQRSAMTTCSTNSAPEEEWKRLGPAVRLARMWIESHYCDKHTNAEIEALCWHILKRPEPSGARLANDIDEVIGRHMFAGWSLDGPAVSRDEVNDLLDRLGAKIRQLIPDSALALRWSPAEFLRMVNSPQAFDAAGEPERSRLKAVRDGEARAFEAGYRAAKREDAS